MTLKVLSLEEWKKLSKCAHLICFGEDQEPESLTCSYALLVTNHEDVPVAYATILEINKTSVYMQHGGAMPNAKKSILAVRAHQMVLQFLREKYFRITTRILNTNLPMIKMSLAHGLLINGIDVLGGEIFLNLFWESDGVLV